MPAYGRHQYGRFKYGKYQLSSGGGGGGNYSLGPHVRYKIRTISFDGKRSDFLVMCEDRVSIPSNETVATRIRTNTGEWVYAQNAIIHTDTVRVRIRSVKDDITSEWVYGDRANLRTE